MLAARLQLFATGCQALADAVKGFGDAISTVL
jgi:hypothetical protein